MPSLFSVETRPSRSLVEQLNPGHLDIIGDIHGELEALETLLASMGYDKEGRHPDNRKLVFVGDLIDRGPDSPGVIRLVRKLIENGNAQACLGNHELNLLQQKAKDGAGWYFEERRLKDKAYMPFSRPETDLETKEIYAFLARLPVALERADLRIVHAAWQPQAISYAKNIPLGNAVDCYNKWEKDINQEISSSGLLARYHAERDQWAKELEDPKYPMPFLTATSQYNVAHQSMNPLRVLTSGVERVCAQPFFASGKWRFVERFAWWNEYTEEVPVIVGHYWRKHEGEENNITSHKAEGEASLFEGVEPFAWHGAQSNVFCVDYSVGGRFVERRHNVPLGTHTKLVALNWPENTLTFENGEKISTENYQGPNYQSDNLNATQSQELNALNKNNTAPLEHLEEYIQTSGKSGPKR